MNDNTNEKEKIVGVIKVTPKDYDSDDLRFKKGETQTAGYGYIGKEDRKVGLIRCPECIRENYGLTVTSGICAWCGFDANEIELLN